MNATSYPSLIAGCATGWIGRVLFSVLIMPLTICLGPGPVSANTITYENTTISYAVSGMGSQTSEGDDLDPCCRPSFWTYYDGVDEAGISPMAGFVTFDITVEATDGIGVFTDEEGNEYTLDGLTLELNQNIWSEEAQSIVSTPYLSTFLEVGQTMTVGAPYSIADGHGAFGYFYFMRSLNGIDGSNYLGVDVIMDNAYWSYAENNKDMAGGPDDNEDTAFDQGGQGSCSSQGLPAYAVNTSFLTLVAEDTDFSYQSFGQTVAMKRTWNMPPDADGMFGPGWRFAYETTILASGAASGAATATLGGGQAVTYSSSGVSGQGSGTATVAFACQSKGRRPILTGILDESSGVMTYRLYDRDRRLTWRYEYARPNPDGGGNIYRLAAVSDDNGNALSAGYDGSGRLVSLTDASGRATTFSYNAQNRVTAMQTFAGTAASYAYDASGNLINATDLFGNVSAFAYDADHYLTSMSVSGKTATFAYAVIDHQKRLASVTDPSGHVRSYSMVSGETRVADPGGHVRAYANTRGRTNMIRNPLGQTTSIAYNDAGLPAWIVHPGGGTETFEYDASGNLTRYQDENNGVAVMTYSQAGDLLTLTDPLGHVWTRTYDVRRNLTKSATPLGRETLFAYDAKGLLTALTGPDGAATGFSYDAYGNLTGVDPPAGGGLAYAYDAHGLEMTSSSDGRGNAFSYVYDANRRRTRMNVPGGGHYDFAYGCCALSSLSDPAGATTALERDALLRITRIVDPAGKATTFSYDADSRLTRRTDPLNRTTLYASDEAGRITRITSPLGGHVDYGRNDRGQVSSLTDQRGNTTTLSYDNKGLLAYQTDPSNRQAFHLTRDGLGRVTTWTNARSGQVNYEYDADGRLTAKKHGSAVVASYAYAASGLLSSVTDPSGNTGALGFSRDALGRVTAMTYPDGLTLGLTYDAAGNVASMTYPGGMTVNYAYDATNRPTQAAFDGKTVDMTYDAAGRMTSETRSNGVTSSYAFDAAGRLTRIRHLKGAAVIVDLAQTRDAAGQITGESGTVPAGPALTTKQAAASYDDADRAASFGSDAFVVDFDGNVTAVSGSRTLALVYDNENRATSLTSGSTTTTYLYNGLGDRVRASAGSATRNFRYDPFGRLVFETDGSGAVTVLYVWSGSRMKAFGAPSGGFVWPLYDRVGSVLALTDGTGTVTAGYAYAPYGARAGKTGSATTSFTYVGAFGVMDEGGGVYFMKNRFYDATTGRFLSRDPIGFLGGDNLYRYALNNPVSRVDPSGLADFEMTHFGWYDVNTAEGTYDLTTGRAPHMAEPATDAELVVTGTIVATTVAAMAVSAALCAAPATGAAATAGAAGAEIDVAALAADQMVAESGIVEMLAARSPGQAVSYIKYLYQSGQHNLLKAINRKAGDLLLQRGGSGTLHTIMDATRDIGKLGLFY